MYPYLKFQDKLPVVAATQILLNRRLNDGEYLPVDGSFGTITREAVEKFQQNTNYLLVDGIIGQNTWSALINKEKIQVIDCVDVTDPKIRGYEDEAIIAAGGNPILNYGMSRGGAVVLKDIERRAKKCPVVLLRFHGHGSPGWQALATHGLGAPRGAPRRPLYRHEEITEASSSFNLENVHLVVRALSKMSPIFCEFGSVELHGCRVGAGSRGRRMVTTLTQGFEVPVTAGTQTQWSEGPGGTSTFRFEGPVFTACPCGINLKRWGASLGVTGERVSVAR